MKLPVLAVTQAGQESILQPVKKGEKNQDTASQHGLGMSPKARQDGVIHDWLCTAIESISPWESLSFPHGFSSTGLTNQNRQLRKYLSSFAETVMGQGFKTEPGSCSKSSRGGRAYSGFQNKTKQNKVPTAPPPPPPPSTVRHFSSLSLAPARDSGIKSLTLMPQPFPAALRGQLDGSIYTSSHSLRS